VCKGAIGVASTSYTLCRRNAFFSLVDRANKLNVNIFLVTKNWRNDKNWATTVVTPIPALVFNCVSYFPHTVRLAGNLAVGGGTNGGNSVSLPVRSIG
jgi:hypothetical protein